MCMSPEVLEVLSEYETEMQWDRHSYLPHAGNIATVPPVFSVLQRATPSPNGALCTLQTRAPALNDRYAGRSGCSLGADEASTTAPTYTRLQD